MGYCTVHQQSYIEQNGGFCIYCGSPHVATKTYVTPDTMSLPPSTIIPCETGVIVPSYPGKNICGGN